MEYHVILFYLVATTQSSGWELTQSDWKGKHINNPQIPRLEQMAGGLRESPWLVAMTEPQRVGDALLPGRK